VRPPSQPVTAGYGDVQLSFYYTGSISRRNVVQAGIGISATSYAKKKKKAERAVSMGQVIEHLPTKCKPQYHKIKKKKKKKKKKKQKKLK
jgi:hypothetical protein